LTALIRGDALQLVLHLAELDTATLSAGPDAGTPKHPGERLALEARGRTPGVTLVTYDTIPFRIVDREV
jgi:hypothetical protein